MSSIKLRNKDVIPNRDYDTVPILGLEVPLTKELPFGGKIEMMDLVARHEDGEFGNAEWLMRMFCLFTRRLPKNEHVRWEWLARQDIEVDEIAELMKGTLALFNHLQESDERIETEQGKPEEPPPATEAASES